MGCRRGLSTILTLPVPPFSGDGAIVDVSAVIGEKTIYLAGEFSGLYTIMGSHDDVRFVPLVEFNGGQGPQPIRRDIKLTLKSMKVRRNADRAVTVNIASQETCTCT